MRSDNKNPRVEPDTPAATVLAMARKRKARYAAMAEFHRTARPGLDRATAAGCIEYGGLVLAARWGNCNEIARACSWSLTQRADNPAHSIVYYPEGNHAFVALGQAANAAGMYPTLFSDWEPDAVICDAWADIACYAREYPAHWHSRMASWNQIHLDIDGQSSMSAEWHDMVNLAKACQLHIPSHATK